ncbi:hypothetical protein [Endozoicomonas sp. YOMI1]|uniref:hypothetical protein n=1 Tax=Endozoicomonas sp. YOMI1 TaxID=2828739 RepID=UPI0021485AD8|nr:hypothetical protein [Endozoicomonas sp. YOMI1]
MSSLVGESGGVQTGITPAPGAPVNVSSDPGNGVSSGYSSANSVSQAGGSSSGGSQAGVSLNAPAGNGVGGVNYLAQALQSKLDTFRATIAYNNALAPGELYFSDTQNLLLSLRGIINDLKVLNSVTTIEIRAADRQAQVSLSLEIGALKKSIEGTQNLINSKQAERDKASDSQKPALDVEIEKLKGKKMNEEVRLTAKEGLFLISGEDNAARDLMVPLVKPVSPESLESGEEQLDELKHELKVIEKRFDSDEVRSRLASLIVAEYERKTVRESDRDVKSLKHQGVKGSTEDLKSLVSPELVDKLFSFYSARDTSALAAVRSQSAPSEQQLTDAAEGLALLLLAEPPVTGSEENPVDQPYPGNSPVIKAADNSQASMLFAQPLVTDSKENTVDQPYPGDNLSLEDAKKSQSLITLAEPPLTASEENPVDQPYLGDSLSLEGANNPQAFALLLLKERMADMQEALSKKSGGGIVDSVESNQLAQLLEAEREVDAMVIEAVRDRERYEADMAKSHPV